MSHNTLWFILSLRLFHPLSIPSLCIRVSRFLPFTVSTSLSPLSHFSFSCLPLSLHCVHLPLSLYPFTVSASLPHHPFPICISLVSLAFFFYVSLSVRLTVRLRLSVRCAPPLAVCVYLPVRRCIRLCCPSHSRSYTSRRKRGVGRETEKKRCRLT